MQSRRSHGNAPHAPLVAPLPAALGSVDKPILLMGFIQSGPWAELSPTMLISVTVTSHIVGHSYILRPNIPSHKLCLKLNFKVKLLPQLKL